MSGQPEVQINLDKFEAQTAAFVRGTAKAVVALAFAVQDEAINNIREVGAIDTGSLRNSIYVETSESNERAEVLAKAIEAGQTVGVKSGEPGNPQEAEAGPPIESGLKARIAACVEHGIYVEMGVTGSAYGDIPERPFLTPAAATVQAKAANVAAQFIADEAGV